MVSYELNEDGVAPRISRPRVEPRRDLGERSCVYLKSLQDPMSASVVQSVPRSQDQVKSIGMLPLKWSQRQEALKFGSVG